MAISSFHIENGSETMGIHNQRVFSTDYLIEKDKSVNEYKEFSEFHIKELVQQAELDYQNNQKNNRKLPSNAKLIKEGVVNLNANHTIDDLERLKEALEERYGFKIRSIAIHRDEGYIYTNDINYSMGRSSFKSEEETPNIAELDFKSGKFYEWKKDDSGEWQRGKEITDYEKHYNYHAHVEYLNYDFKAHRTVRNSYKDLSRMQTITAEVLNLERGKCSSTVEAKRIGVKVEQSRKRMNIREYKNYKRKENELLAVQKDLKSEIKNLRKELSGRGLAKEDFAKVNAVNKKLQKQLADKELTVNEMKSELQKVREELETKIKNLQEQLKKSKNNYKTSTNLLNSYIKEKNDFKKQVEELENREPEIKVIEKEIVKEVSSEADTSKIEELEQQLKTVRNLRKSDKAKIKELEAKEPEIKVVEKEVIKEIPVVKEVEKVVTKEVEDTSKIAALEQHLKNTKSILSDYIKRNKELKKQVSKEVSSEADTEKIAALEEQLRRRREEAEERETYLKSMHSQALKAKNNELEKLREENDTLKSEKNVSRRDIDDLKANLEAELREYQREEKKANLETREIFEEHKIFRMQSVSSIVSFLKDKYYELKDKVKELTKENEELKSKAPAEKKATTAQTEEAEAPEVEEDIFDQIAEMLKAKKKNQREELK